MKYIKKAFKDTLPIFAGYIFLGMGFGMMLEKIGYGADWALVMSIVLFAGSMQYVAVELLAVGASLITCAITTLMVNARHIFYGISMVDKYRGMGKFKPYLEFALTDETYSLLCMADIEDKKDRKTYYFAVSVLDHIYWITGCVLGNLVGQILPFSSEGVEFALTALFLTIFTEQWQSTKDHSSALTGLISTFLCLIIFGSENFLIPSMIVITVVLTLNKKKTEDKADE